ncbi:hypothetical protein NPIL_332251, partial [Nephila pilipes]
CEFLARCQQRRVSEQTWRRANWGFPAICSMRLSLRPDPGHCSTDLVEAAPGQGRVKRSKCTP